VLVTVVSSQSLVQHKLSLKRKCVSNSRQACSRLVPSGAAVAFKRTRILSLRRLELVFVERCLLVELLSFA